MGSILAWFPVRRKMNEGWRRIVEERQTEEEEEEEAKGCLHPPRMPSYEGAYLSQQALIITQQCPT